ncbi:hypothetical protein EV363DRAFT_1253106 [Boletus edulis]|nr:hypothetical protein EV363DRAFT_1253106 [Boletus edulis]
MTTGVFSVFSSIFGFVVAAISLLAFAVNMCRSHLPSNKIKVLESLLDETETCFRKAIEDGLLTEPPFVLQTESGLIILKTRAQGLRSRAHNATNLRQDYAEFLRGTSTAIERVCQSLRKLKAQVITSSEEGRLRCIGTNSVSGATFSPLLHISPEHRPSPQLFQIPRPSSCPPALPAWSRAKVRVDSTRHPTQSVFDVRTIDVQCLTPTVHTSITLRCGA